jgi:hypothetical protein
MLNDGERGSALRFHVATAREELIRGLNPLTLTSGQAKKALSFRIA